jgi:hypothetical protein
MCKCNAWIFFHAPRVTLFQPPRRDFAARALTARYTCRIGETCAGREALTILGSFAGREAMRRTWLMKTNILGRARQALACQWLARCAMALTLLHGGTRIGLADSGPSLPSPDAASPSDARLPVPETLEAPAGPSTADDAHRDQTITLVDAPACEVWFISTRGAGCPAPGGPVRLGYWRRGEHGQWIEAEAGQFLAEDDPTTPTCFYIHGNRASFGESRAEGLQVYHGLTANMCAHQPFRFVIWSWPADQIKGVLEDARVKAHRCDTEAYHLAWLIDQMPPDEPVSLIGYSFGARLATGALHILGGGQVAGRALHPRVHPDRSPVSGVLIAAALDNFWLAPGSRHGLALTQVHSLLVFVNPTDKVLKRYHLLYGKRAGQQALGATGVAGGLGPARMLVDQVNVSGWVGTSHDIERYLCSSAVMSRVARYAVFGASYQH